MAEVALSPLGRSTRGQGKILSGFFKDDAVQVEVYDLFSRLLVQGHEVLHVGTNVTPALFIRQMQTFSPQVIVLICQGRVDSIKQVIELIKEEKMRSMARIILYGPGIEESVRDEVHADAYAENELDLLDMIEEIMGDAIL